MAVRVASNLDDHASAVCAQDGAVLASCKGVTYASTVSGWWKKEAKGSGAYLNAWVELLPVGKERSGATQISLDVRRLVEGGAGQITHHAHPLITVVQGGGGDADECPVRLRQVRHGHVLQTDRVAVAVLGGGGCDMMTVVMTLSTGGACDRWQKAEGGGRTIASSSTSAFMVAFVRLSCGRKSVQD